MKVLVADDNQVNCKHISEILKGQADCDTAVNGEEAIDSYLSALSKNKPYDILLLDIGMPIIDGMSVLQYIREKEKSPEYRDKKRVPIIMITASGDYSEKVFSMGCDAYLEKPVQDDVLIENINNAICKEGEDK